MQFESLFLDKTAQLKLALRHKLDTTAPHGITIADLSNQMQLSYQRTYNLFQELLDDFERLTEQTPTVLRKAVMNGHIPISLDAYRFYLLRNAVAFEFFDYVVQGHQPNIDRFCTDHFISQSTLTRKTVPLRRFLAQYGLKLTTASATLTGGEVQVRLCLQTFYWQATHGADWPFTTIALAAIRQQVTTMPPAHDLLTQQQLIYLTAISHLRIAQGHRLDPATTAKLPARTYFTASDFPQLSADQLVAENQYVTWYQIGTFRFTTNAELTSLSKHVPVAGRVVAHILASLATCDAPGICQLAHETLFYQNLFRATICFSLLQSNYIKPSDFSEPELIVPQLLDFKAQLTAIIADLPATGDYAVFHRESAAYCNEVAFLVAPHLQTAAPSNTLNVAVQLNIDNILHRGLVNFLDNLSFVKRLPPESAIDHCDLLITESERLLSAGTSAFNQAHPEAVFIWCLDATEVDFHHLYQTLCRRYQQKLVPRSSAN
ncbi:helix-turn-helix domain-containing protein [Lacticaseibacillus sp. GG6-2]